MTSFQTSNVLKSLWKRIIGLNVHASIDLVQTTKENDLLKHENNNGSTFKNQYNYQRWSRGHRARGQGQEQKKIRGQGQGQPFRGQTLSKPRTGMLEAKAQEHRWQVFSKKKSPKFFSGDLPPKRSSTTFFTRLQEKHGLQKFFSSGLQNFNVSKNSAVLDGRQGNFQGLEASRPRQRT